jgi:hypothetical protein
MKIKHLFYLSVLALLGFVVSGHSEEAVINDFSGGMWSYLPPNKIPDNAASLLLNVFTDEGGLFNMRRGYGAGLVDCGPSTYVGVSSPTIQGVFTFTSASGTEYLVAASSGNLNFAYRYVGGAASCAQGNVSTTTVHWVYNATTTYQAVETLGKLWVTDGVDIPVSLTETNTGSGLYTLTASSVTTMPRGKLIAAWRNRVVVTRSTSSPSSVYFSGDGDGTSWTLGGNPTDPFELTIGGANDGRPIRCMASYGDDLIIGKYNELWRISGFDQEDVTVRKISSGYGCVDQGSIQEKDNALIWLSNRGVVAMQGDSIQVISDPIKNYIDAALRNNVFTSSPIPAVSAVYEGRYWLALSTVPLSYTTGPWYNQTQFILQRNLSWTMADMPVTGGMTVWKDAYLWLGIMLGSQPGTTSAFSNGLSVYQYASTDIQPYVNGGRYVGMQVDTRSYDFQQPFHQKEIKNVWLRSKGDTDFDDSDPFWTLRVNYDDDGTYNSAGNSTTLGTTGLIVDKFPMTFNGSLYSKFYSTQFRITKGITLNFGEAPRLYDIGVEYSIKEPL